jgi:site-specific recombinase XerD
MELEDQTTQKYIRFLEVEQNASPHTVLAYRRALCDFKASWASMYDGERLNLIISELSYHTA